MYTIKSAAWTLGKGGRCISHDSNSHHAHVQHEAALTTAEGMLEEDAAAFNRFLKASDEKVQAAMRCADVELKAKQEKVCCQALSKGLCVWT